jgi:O-antigen ligase
VKEGLAVLREQKLRGKRYPSNLAKLSLPRTENIPFFVRLSFLLYVFTIALEAADLPYLNSGTFSVARLSGFVFFGSYLCYHSPLFGKPLPMVPIPVWWFVTYLAVYLIHAPFIEQGDFGRFAGRFYTLVQLLAFFWVASNLLRSQKMMKDVLWVYAASWLMVAAGLLFNLPGFAVEEFGSAEQRLTIEGYNPNGLAVCSSLAVLSLIGIFVNKQRKGFIANALLLTMILPFLAAIAKTGSRGGAIALVAGFVVFLFPIWRSSRKVVAWVLATVGAMGLVYIITSNPLLLARWEKTYYEGDTAGRDRIAIAGLEMVQERPLLGWGYVEAGEELGYRTLNWLDRSRGAHNIILQLLIEVGIVGTIPFITGLFLCGWAAWHARRGPQKVLPLAILATLAVGSLTGNLHAKKVFWLMLALAMGAEHQALSLDRLRRVFAEGGWRQKVKSHV